MVDSHALSDRIEARKSQLIEVLRDLLRFETVSGVTDAVAIETFERETRRCLDYLRDFAHRHGLEYREHPAGVAVIDWGEGDEVIGFPTHTDVVPPGERWHQPPFEGVVKDGVVYGRGTQDDKGPMACGMIGLLAIRDLGRPTRRTLRLIFGTREEPGDWTDVAGYLEDEPAPLHCIVPDATFPITNGEKGMATVQLTPPRVAPLERKDGLRLDFVRAGERFNIVPDRAVVRFSGPNALRQELFHELTVELEAYEKSRLIMLDEPLQFHDAPNEEGRWAATLTFLGKSAHGSRPEEGHNAAIDALGFLVRLGFPKTPVADFVGFCYCGGKDLVGEYLGVDHFHDFIGLTSSSLNIFKLAPHAGHAQFNIRFPLGLTSRQLIERLRKKIAERIPEADRQPAAEFEGIVHEPLFVDPETYPEFFAAMEEAFETVAGRPARRRATGGTTYAKAFPRAVSFGPTDEEAGERDMAHKADECVSIDALVRNAKIYAHALAALCLA